jgi:hypothetical protein
VYVRVRSVCTFVRVHVGDWSRVESSAAVDQVDAASRFRPRRYLTRRRFGDDRMKLIMRVRTHTPTMCAHGTVRTRVNRNRASASTRRDSTRRLESAVCGTRVAPARVGSVLRARTKYTRTLSARYVDDA